MGLSELSSKTAIISQLLNVSIKRPFVLTNISKILQNNDIKSKQTIFSQIFCSSNQAICAT